MTWFVADHFTIDGLFRGMSLAWEAGFRSFARHRDTKSLVHRRGITTGSAVQEYGYRLTRWMASLGLIEASS